MTEEKITLENCSKIMRQKKFDNPTQGQAWSVVNQLCIELGMPGYPEDDHLNGIEKVVKFIIDKSNSVEVKRQRSELSFKYLWDEYSTSIPELVAGKEIMYKSDFFELMSLSESHNDAQQKELKELKSQNSELLDKVRRMEEEMGKAKEMFAQAVQNMHRCRKILQDTNGGNWGILDTSKFDEFLKSSHTVKPEQTEEPKQQPKKSAFDILIDSAKNGNP